MNATQEINGKLYKRVPVEDGRCTGCAFYDPKSDPLCGLLSSDATCHQPYTVIFVLVNKTGFIQEPDEQCGVGNG